MGIPKYFRHITGKYPTVVKNVDTKVQIQNLYFDMNCLIHPCVRTVTKEYPHLVDKHKKLEPQDKYQNDKSFHTEFELKIYKEIKEYLDKLIKIVEPESLIYLSIDGVAPRAKMEQQRTRRFRSIKEARMQDEIYSKHGIERSHFDTNCITPGTIFLYKLSHYLRTYCKEKFEELNVKITLDDCQNQGEGEHKILQHIKENTLEEVGCIYGLDADLIMLSLCTGAEIYLLREDVYFGKVDTNSFLYLDIEELGEHLYNDIKYSILEKMDNEVEEEMTLEKQDIINDYICLCFLIGNDFLPHLNGIDILTNSINDLLEIYISIIVVRHKHLVIDNSINFIFLRQILTNLYSNEEIYLPKFQKKKQHFRPRLEYNNDMELELEKLRFYPRFNNNKKINLGEDGWMNEYYKYYFDIDNVVIRKEDINDICNNYVEGLQWNIKYYLEKCPSYTWYYKYRAAPCLRELSIFLINRVYPAKFDEETTFTPLEQLSIVLPIQSSHLWAKTFKNRVNSDFKLISYYPTDFALDIVNHNFLYECDPILSDVDHDYIKEIHKTLTFSQFEKERNKITGLITYEPDADENIKLNIEI